MNISLSENSLSLNLRLKKVLRPNKGAANFATGLFMFVIQATGASICAELMTFWYFVVIELRTKKAVVPCECPMYCIVSLPVLSRT